jgi:hypothetical protein
MRAQLAEGPPADSCIIAKPRFQPPQFWKRGLACSRQLKIRTMAISRTSTAIPRPDFHIVVEFKIESP